jgi:hypothetical protein
MNERIKHFTNTNNPIDFPKVNEEDLVYRLRKRAEIRRQITSRKSVQEGKADRISDLLEEGANEIERLEQLIADLINERIER